MTRALYLTVEQGTLRAELRIGKSVAWAGEAQFADAGELADAIAALVAEAPLRRVARTCVAVKPPLVQFRTLNGLPPVSGHALAALVANQSSRYFRKNGKSLVTDAVWARGGRRWRRRTRPPRAAYAAAIEAPWVEAILAGASAAGLPLPNIFPAVAVRARALDLVPASARSARAHRARRVTRRLAVLAIALWAGSGALYVARLRSLRNRLDREAVQLQPASDAAVAARVVVRDADAMVGVIAAAAADRGSLLTRFGELLSQMPDSSYLTAIDLDERGNGTATGGARRGADIVARIERAGVVQRARLDGAPLPELLDGIRRERFTVRFGGEANP